MALPRKPTIDYTVFTATPEGLVFPNTVDNHDECTVGEGGVIDAIDEAVEKNKATILQQTDDEAHDPEKDLRLKQ